MVVKQPHYWWLKQLFIVLKFLQHLQTENETLKKTLEKVQSQLETSLEAQDQQRKVLDAINRQFGDHLNALGELQNELSAVLNTWLLHKTQWISN